ncbi:MAG: endonuclease/exonuclease/phosphatase family protein [bacterium]|nr:endonuclease/exonuclease/phosphatase family protein [bacterium]
MSLPFHRPSIGPRLLPAALIALALAAPAARAELMPIQLDGFFDDWAEVQPLHVDPAGDGSTVDFRAVSVVNDHEYLYLRFEVTGDVQPDEQQSLELYLDTDLNAATGTSFGGIGAELVWRFGSRNGTYRPAGTSYTVYHDNVGLMIGPTVSSSQFEVALRRGITPAGGVPFLAGGAVRFILRDATSGDLCPNSGSLSYTITAGSDVAPTLPLGRDNPAHLRLMTWNILQDGLWDDAKFAAQDRLLDAIDPDVMVLNEIWDHSAVQTAARVETFLPSGAGEQWYAAKVDAGNVIVSRLPILQTWLVNGSTSLRESAALLDLGPLQAKDLLLVACHLRCCTDDATRQDEADGLVKFLRDARTAGGVITLPVDTPIILAGDMNLVGWGQQLDTIVTGDIVDNATYGVDSAPDWDGTDLAVPPSRHPDGRAGYTWRSDSSSYYPGLLDWIFYTDSALTLHHHYILETRTLLPATRTATGLQAADIPTASDHAPRVADFTVGTYVSSVPGAGATVAARLLPNLPNPFNPSTQLRFALDRPGEAALNVYDLQGRLVRAFPAARFEAGTHAVTWNGRDAAGRAVASGVYEVVLSARLGAAVVRQSRSVVLVQ